MWICQKNKLRKMEREYLNSLEKSEEAIKNVMFSDGMAPLYFSNRKLEEFYNAFRIKPVISSVAENGWLSENSLTSKASVKIKGIAEKGHEGINTESRNGNNTRNYGIDSDIITIKNNIEIIKQNGCSILDAIKNNFFYANFPVFHGNLFEFDKCLETVYLWHGEYRNIKLYLCGNTKNVFSVDKKEYPKAIWNPSTIEGQKDIFEYLVDEVSNTNYKNKNIFDLFEKNIKQSVMNRNGLSKSFYQWHEMIAYCTNIKNENGIQKIIGIPLLVIPSRYFGYGWYNLKLDLNKDGNFINKDHPNNKNTYFEFNGRNFTGKFLLKENEIYYNDFSNEFDVVDGNDAYKLGTYTVNRTKQIPHKEQVCKSDDIIGVYCYKNHLI